MVEVRVAVPWRRVSRLLTAGALATVLVACGNGSLGNSTDGSKSTSVLQGDPAVLVAGSASRTTAAKNAKVDLNGTVATMGQNIALTGNGTADFVNKTFQLNITVPGMGVVEERVIDGIIYVRIPQAEAAQFGGKSWLKIDPKAFGGANGGKNPFATLDNTNPSQILNTLQGAAKVTQIGDEDVRGVHTVHYRADVDIAKAADAQGLTPEQKQRLQQTLGGQSTLPEDVWLDDQGLVRRLAIDVSATPQTGAGAAPTSVKTTMRIEFYDYDQPTAAVTAPPADQVSDFSQIVGQLGQLGSLNSDGGTTPS